MMEIIEAKNIFAHRLLYEGNEYKMSIASISDDHMSIEINPYVQDVPGTVFVSGTVEIVLKEDKIMAIHHLAE